MLQTRYVVHRRHLHATSLPFEAEQKVLSLRDQLRQMNLEHMTTRPTGYNQPIKSNSIVNNVDLMSWTTIIQEDHERSISVTDDPDAYLQRPFLKPGDLVEI